MNKTFKKISAIALSFVMVVAGFTTTAGTMQVEAAKKVSLSTTKKTINKGQSFNLSIKNAKGTIKWSTSNSNVASIKKASKTKYKVTGNMGGSATISVKVGKKTYKCKVTVKGLNVTTKTMNVGQKVTVSALNLGQKVSWSVSNKKAATIKASKAKATVTAKAAGTVTVTAKVSGKKYTCKLVISNPKQSSGNVNVTEGKTETLKLSGVTSGTKVTWSAPNAKVAKGKAGSTSYTVTGVKAGKTTVKASVNGKTFTWNITVKAASKPEVKPDEKPEEKPDPNPNPGLDAGADNETSWGGIY